MGHMLPAFNPETDVYRLANGVDMLPSNNMLQKFSDHLWSFNSIPNFCELGAQAASNIGSLGPPSLLVGANPTETMKLRNSPDDAMQSYVIGNGYSAYNCNTSNPIGNLMAQTHQFNSSGFGPVQRPSAIQNSSPASIQERLFSGQRFSSNGGEFGENHAWPGGNAGTELLLLPGRGEGLGKTLPQSNEFNTRPSSMGLYGVNQGSLPISHDWKIPDLSSAKNELVFSKDSLSIGNNMRQGQGLSLSLSSHPHTQSINLDNMDMRNIPGPGSFGVIRTSKYVKPAQHLLDEFCNVTKGPKKASQNPLNSPTMTEAGTTNATADQNSKKSDSSFMEAASAATTQAAASAGTTMKPSSSQPVTHDLNAKPMHPEERNQLQLKKARLISMVEEVDKTYGQYKEQMQIVMTSFESAAGLGSSAPYTALARQAMSRHFRLLRDAIGGQIERICKALGEDPSSVPVLCKGETPRLRILDQQLRHQRALQQIGVLQQQPWRPQRGLPERSVSVLRAWLFEHFLHPYPKDTEKLMLARQTGLSRSQVSNWFINARVRLWKPMIEEMYVEEGKQAEKLAATGAEGTTKSKLREGDNQKESCTTTNNDPKEDNVVKGPADVVSCSLSHANSSDSEYLSDGRPVFRVEVNDRNVGAEEWKRANTGVTLTLGLQQSNTNTQTFGGEINYQNSRISLYSHMGTTPQISSAQQQKLSQSSW